ncbi:MAG: GAF domain-containing protein [Proteobacteria bacterium]|nr:MAG: GAF domain-containing protein [Pseudomonadota bacterium]
MIDNPVGEYELSRLAALESYKILDTVAEQAFDDLTSLASHICETPIALFGLIDETRVWFKSKVGFGGETIPREISFCTHTIAGDGCLIVPDLDQDERFHDHPLRAIHPEVRFYAGVPIITSEGHAIGAVCVLDQKPRVLSDKQITALEAISRQALEHLESRNRLVREQEFSKELSRSKKQLDDFFDLADDLLCIVEADGKFSKVSRSFEAVLGYSQALFEQRRQVHSHVLAFGAQWGRPHLCDWSRRHQPIEDGERIAFGKKPCRSGNGSQGQIFGKYESRDQNANERYHRYVDSLDRKF